MGGGGVYFCIRFLARQSPDSWSSHYSHEIILSFRNAKTVDLYENRAFIYKSEYYNNYHGNIKETTP